MKEYSQSNNLSFQALRSRPLPKVREFHLNVDGEHIVDPAKKLRKLKHRFNVNVEEKSQYSVKAAVVLPDHFPSGSSCKVIVKSSSYDIYYKVGSLA